MIDVILPIYNPNEKIYNAINSVINQTYKKWHLIIIDDGSKDSMLEKIRNQYIKYNNKITYIQLELNLRAAGARNHAIAQSNGKYIAFIDQDDIWVETKLENQVTYIVQSKREVVHGNIIMIDNQGKIIHTKDWQKENNTRVNIEWDNISKIELARKIFLKPNIRIITSVISRDLFEEIGGFHTEFFGGEDEIYWFEVAMNAKIGYLNQVLIKRREHPANTVKIEKYNRLKGLYKAIKFAKKEYSTIIDDIFDTRIKEVSYKLVKQAFIEQEYFYFLIHSFILFLKYPVFFFTQTKKIVHNK